jgi:Putative Flp pilus-assembly TadE/G-like
VTSRHRPQHGQSLVLAALLITALTGLVGLAVDGGEAANEQQIVRSAADGAALAGAYSISKGSTLAAATTMAGQVLAAVPLLAGDLVMTYLDSAGSVTAVPASVAKVRAVVTDNHPTYFLKALGVATLRLAATAESSAGGGAVGTPAACAVCVMTGTGTTLYEWDNASMTISGGPLQVNSNGGSALTQQDGATLTAPSIVVVGGVNQGNGTITPAPTGGSAIPDPLAAIVTPVVAGVATNFTAPAGASALAPGVYATVTVNTGSVLTLNPGTFVITTQLKVNGGTVIGAGVTIFEACTTYPTACGSGVAGGNISVTSGTLTLSPPASGTYFGLTVFADRNDTSWNSFSASTVNVSGTWYTLTDPLVDFNTGDHLSFGQLIIATIFVTNDMVFTATRSATQSYGTGGGGTLKLTL